MRRLSQRLFGRRTDDALMRAVIGAHEMVIDRTYAIGKDAAGYKWILCFHCGRKSHNLNDIEQKYCGHCHVFHEL